MLLPLVNFNQKLVGFSYSTFACAVGFGSRPMRSNSTRLRSISRLAMDMLTAEGTLPSLRSSREGASFHDQFKHQQLFLINIHAFHLSFY